MNALFVEGLFQLFLFAELESKSNDWLALKSLEYISAAADECPAEICRYVPFVYRAT